MGGGTEPEVTETSAGEVEILKESGKAKIGEYTVEAGSLEYGFYTSFYGSDYYGWDYGNNPFKVFDKAGKEFKDYRIEIESVVYNGKTHDKDQVRNWLDLRKVYEDGLKPGDKIDLGVKLYVHTYNITTETQEMNEILAGEGSIRDVMLTKKKITPKNFTVSQSYYRGTELKESLEKNEFSRVYGDTYSSLYFRLTENGKKKVGDFSSSDEYKLVYGEDYTVFAKSWMDGEEVEINAADYYDIELENSVAFLFFRDVYEIRFDIEEIQSGKAPDEFRKILRKHASLYINDEKQDWDASEMKIEVEGVSNDEQLGEYLKKEDEHLDFKVSADVKLKNGKTKTVTTSSHDGGPDIWLQKNAYNLYLDEFEEVASATGASYDRTVHDYMVNLYAIKNETEKIRVGSLGNKERFRLWVWKYDGTSMNSSEIKDRFSKIRPGDKLDWDFSGLTSAALEYIWYIPDETRKSGHARLQDTPTLRFFEYTGLDPAKDPSNPFSEVHMTDGTDAPTLSSDSAPYTFDEEKSVTLIGAVKVNIKKKFESYVSNNAYVESAKHRYVLDKTSKKYAKIDKKGNITPKKSGKIKIWLEQKNGKKWERIGDPVELYIQVPKMPKKYEAKEGEKLQGRTLISGSTFAPNSWKVTKKKIADIDPVTGEITFKKKGSVVIIAVYGEGKNSSKKKYKTKIKVKKAP